MRSRRWWRTSSPMAIRKRRGRGSSGASRRVLRRNRASSRNNPSSKRKRVGLGFIRGIQFSTFPSPGGQSMSATISLHVNGRPVTVTTDPERPLLDVLREDLGLTGTKYGCGEGACGACSVLIDEQRVFACSTPVAQLEGKSVR